MPTCLGCNKEYSISEYPCHLLQATQPACIQFWDETEAWLLDTNDEEEDIDSPYKFKGDLFGRNYTKEDFGYDSDSWNDDGLAFQSLADDTDANDNASAFWNSDNEDEFNSIFEHFAPLSPLPSLTTSNRFSNNEYHGCLLTKAEYQAM